MGVPSVFGSALGSGGGVFGGSTGPLRLLNDALGGQAGWLLGFALVAGLALVVSTRLSRPDPVTGWILAVGGSALTAAVAFSSAKGIFHPYYVSELAPFTAALVGAGFVRFAQGDLLARVAGPLAIFTTKQGELVALDRATGAQRMAFDFKVTITAQPIVAEGWMYIATGEGRVLAVELGDSIDGWHMWGGNAQHNLL